METLRHHGYRQCPSSSPIICPRPAPTCSAAGRSCARSPCPGWMWGEGWLMRSPSPAQNGCRGCSKIILMLQPSFCHSHQSAASSYYLFFSSAESQSGLQETTQSFLGAGEKMEENTNYLHCHLRQSVFQIPLFSEGGSREPPAIIGNDTQLS